MFRIMLQKLWHKKWMNFCLLLGSILLIATVVSFPLYQAAAYDRMLRDEFGNYLQSEGKWPTMNALTTVSKKDKSGSTISRMEEFMKTINDDLGVTARETVFYYLLSKMEVHSAMNREELEDLSVRLGTLSDLPAHARMINGEMFSESGIAPDGSIEVVVSQSGMVNMELLVGETIVFNDLTDAEGNEIRMTV